MSGDVEHVSTPAFITLETFSIAQRGTVHVVDNPDGVEPRSLVDRLVRLDGELRRVTAVESGGKHLGLMVRGEL